MTTSKHIPSPPSALEDEHGIYIGTIKITYLEDTSNPTLAIRVFSDDLQNAIRHQFALSELPTLETLCDNPESTLQTYFQAHLNITINEVPVPLQLSDCEQINEVHELYFSMNAPTTWQSLAIKADFFMELFPTQSNVLQIEYKSMHSDKQDTFFGRMTTGKESLYIDF